MQFLLRRAIKLANENGAERFAQDANRAFKELARYHPLYNRLWRKGFDMRDLKQAEVLLEVLAALQLRAARFSVACVCDPNPPRPRAAPPGPPDS
jgi:hypothetical protein